MAKITEAYLTKLRAIVGPADVITKTNTLQHGSRDYYWFSPVLKPQLDDKVADVIVRPQTIEQLVAVIALTVQAKVPITPRGAGTGNYGQAVPIERGVIISTKKLNQILALTPKKAQVEAGVILHTIEMEARKIGAELRYFPSTLPTATAGGFLAGGSAGIGSITWGNMWDPGNVLQATVVTIEDKPQIITLDDPEALRQVIHNCGLTCIIADLTFALAPAQAWQQYVVAFSQFEEALRFAEKLAYDEALTKRLITVVEWPIPTYFSQLRNEGICPEEKSLLFLHVPLSPDQVQPKIAEAGGKITWHSPQASLHRGGIELTDFTWNHTTLWAIKADAQLTYLQEGFDPKRLYEQIRQRKARYGNDIHEHIEFMKSGGEVRPVGLPIVRFHSKAQLWDLMAYCESIGMTIANPHTTYLDEDSRWNGQIILDAKARWDPHSLLNPGHLRILEADTPD